MTLFHRSATKLILISFLVLLLGVLTFSIQPVGVTFATGQGQGGLELTVDSVTYYNGVLQPSLSWDLKDLVPGVDHFFNFTDVKPGDTGVSTISVHIKKNPAWVCLDFLNLTDEENGKTEPERLLDTDSDGELSSELEFFAWFDDGDNEFEVGEELLFGANTQVATSVLRGRSYPIADSATSEPIRSNRTKYIGVAWCAGDLMVDSVTADIFCDANAMSNAAQTDSMTLDISLRAVAANLLPNYTCTSDLLPTGGYVHGYGNNGHGNDHDHNDDSNPGYSNDPDDDTDNDGKPGHHADDNHHNNGYATKWHKPDKQEKSRFAGWFSFFGRFN